MMALPPLLKGKGKNCMIPIIEPQACNYDNNNANLKLSCSENTYALTKSVTDSDIKQISPLNVILNRNEDNSKLQSPSSSTNNNNNINNHSADVHKMKYHNHSAGEVSSHNFNSNSNNNNSNNTNMYNSNNNNIGNIGHPFVGAKSTKFNANNIQLPIQCSRSLNSSPVGHNNKYPIIAPKVKIFVPDSNSTNNNSNINSPNSCSDLPLSPDSFNNHINSSLNYASSSIFSLIDSKVQMSRNASKIPAIIATSNTNISHTSSPTSNHSNVVLTSISPQPYQTSSSDDKFASTSTQKQSHLHKHHDRHDHQHHHHNQQQQQQLNHNFHQQQLNSIKGGHVAASQNANGNNLPMAQIPKMFDIQKEYEVIKVIGTGTFGIVSLIRSYSTGELYALKAMNKKTLQKLRQVSHVNSEHEILSTLQHPFMINLHDSMQDKVNIYFIMDYMIGGELFSYLQKYRKFDNDTCRFYAAQVVSALKYLHSRDIIYRDLKPENILIDQHGNLKLIDFGFAKKIKDGRTYTLCGTPEYLAPEIILGKGHGKAADWWSVGVLIFEMTYGYSPFYDDDQMKLYEKIVNGKLVFKTGIDFACQSIITQLINTDLTYRLGNMKDGVKDIENHLWFQSVNWTHVYMKAIPPPILPSVAEPTDCSNFDDFSDVKMKFDEASEEVDDDNLNGKVDDHDDNNNVIEDGHPTNNLTATADDILRNTLNSTATMMGEKKLNSKKKKSQYLAYPHIQVIVKPSHQNEHKIIIAKETKAETIVIINNNVNNSGNNSGNNNEDEEENEANYTMEFSSTSDIYLLRRN